MRIKIIIPILIMFFILVGLLGCGSTRTTDSNTTNTSSNNLKEKTNEEKANEEKAFNEKVKNSVSAISKSEEAIDLEKFNDMSSENMTYSFELQDLIDNSKNKTVVLSIEIDDIAKMNNDYYVYATYHLYNSEVLFKLKCNKEQLDKFVQDKNKHKNPYDVLRYIIVGKVNTSFKSKLNLTSDVTDNTDKENPESQIVMDFDNILIIEGELLKVISYESIK